MNSFILSIECSSSSCKFVTEIPYNREISILIGNKLRWEPGITSIDFCGIRGIELDITDLGNLVLVVKKYRGTEQY